MCGWLERVATVFVVIAILAGVWWWSGAPMHDGPARSYQCSVGNLKAWVCDQPARTAAP